MPFMPGKTLPIGPAAITVHNDRNVHNGTGLSELGALSTVDVLNRPVFALAKKDAV